MKKHHTILPIKPLASAFHRSTFTRTGNYEQKHYSDLQVFPPPPTPVYRQYWLVLTLLALPLSLHAFFTPQIKEVDV